MITKLLRKRYQDLSVSSTYIIAVRRWLGQMLNEEITSLSRDEIGRILVGQQNSVISK